MEGHAQPGPQAVATLEDVLPAPWSIVPHLLMFPLVALTKVGQGLEVGLCNRTLGEQHRRSFSP